MSADLHALNRAYLIILRDEVKTDPARACAKFGIDSSFATKIAQMSLLEIEEVANTDDVIFTPRVSSQCFEHLARLGDKTSRTVLSAMGTSGLTIGRHEKARS